MSLLSVRTLTHIHDDNIARFKIGVYASEVYIITQHTLKIGIYASKVYIIAQHTLKIGTYAYTCSH